VIDKYTRTDPAYQYTISYTVNNGVKNVTITQTTALSAAAKLVRVYRLAAPVDVNVRYTIYTRPYAAVLDSSKYFDVEAQNLMNAGFIPGRHFTVMTKDEAYKFDGNTCITFATEPHFLISQQDNTAKNVSYPESFVKAVRKFVESGGNFLAQCGGLSTYGISPSPDRPFLCTHLSFFRAVRQCHAERTLSFPFVLKFRP